MTDTTSIHDLPTNPVGGGNIANNVSLSANEIPNIGNPTPIPSLTLDQSTISQIVNGIQQASATGATLLPSRDIPRNTESITNDPSIQPNYIPSNQTNDYIKDYNTPQEMIDNYNKNIKQSNSLDDLYEEFQTPLLFHKQYNKNAC